MCGTYRFTRKKCIRVHIGAEGRGMLRRDGRSLLGSESGFRRFGGAVRRC